MQWASESWAYHALAATLAVAALALMGYGLFGDRSRGRRRCPRCWYDLSGSPADHLTCPECGHDAGQERRLYRARRRWRHAIAALLLAAVALYGYEVRRRVVALSEPWRTAVVPSTTLVLALGADDREGLQRLLARALSSSSRMWGWQEDLLARACLRVAQRGVAPQNAEAADGLARIAPRRGAGIEDLAALLDHPDRAVSDRAAQGLMWLPVQSVRGVPDELLDRIVRSPKLRQRERFAFEMARRGKAEFIPALEAALALNSDRFGSNDALVCLTAMRRLQGRPDPFRVQVEGGPGFTCSAGSLPRFKVGVLNADAEAAVEFFYGGDNRGPRQERFRFEVRNAAGRFCPLKPSENWGGRGSVRTLAPGESWDTKLDMNAYVEPLAPGQYTLTILHHGGENIAQMKEVEGLVVISSEKLRLTVLPASAEP